MDIWKQRTIAWLLPPSRRQKNWISNRNERKRREGSTGYKHFLEQSIARSAKCRNEAVINIYGCIANPLGIYLRKRAVVPWSIRRTPFLAVLVCEFAQQGDDTEGTVIRDMFWDEPENGARFVETKRWKIRALTQKSHSTSTPKHGIVRCNFHVTQFVAVLVNDVVPLLECHGHTHTKCFRTRKHFCGLQLTLGGCHSPPSHADYCAMVREKQEGIGPYM